MNLLSTFSRAVNYLSGGRRDQTLCARMARAHGHWCLFCRIVGWLVRDRDHCWQALLNDVRQ